MRSPGKSTAVDNDAAKRGTVPTHKFCERMHNNVGAIIDRFQEHWGRDSVIDDEGDAVAMSHAGKSLNVTDVACRIAYAFAKDCSRSLID